MKRDPATLYDIISRGDVSDVARALAPHRITVHPHEIPEVSMDVRTPAAEMTIEDAKAAAVQRLHTLLNDEVDALPGHGDRKARKRDLAMRLAITVFDSLETPRQFLHIIHALDRMYPYDANEALIWTERARDIAETQMRAAEQGANPGLYTAWAMLHQLAEQESDDIIGGQF